MRAYFYSNIYIFKKKIYKCKIKFCPYSLAVTKGILDSFFFCAALTDMFKFSA
jgi:hypothetical protein